jgi:hypothetical protein
MLGNRDVSEIWFEVLRMYLRSISHFSKKEGASSLGEAGSF